MAWNWPDNWDTKNVFLHKRCVYVSKLHKNHHKKSQIMFKNYFKVAWRTILKNKGLFSINIIGLSLGIATCLAITLFVVDEWSYDRFNKKADQMARVILKAKLGDEMIRESSVPAPVAAALVSEFPEVLDATRISNTYGLQKVTYKKNTVRKGKMVFVDPNFFKLFTLPLLKGNSNTALDQPNTVVLTTTQAEAYFGNEDPLNKSIKIEGRGLYTVTGIIDEVPTNSHFHFDIFASMKSNPDAKSQNWMQGSYTSYLLFAEGTDLAQFESKLPAVVKKYMGSQLEKGLGMTYEKFLEIGNDLGLYVQPLTDIHLYSDFTGTGDFEAGGDINTVYIFTAVALFMLLIACINFMNLSTAGASKRVKEIGMRKVLGSKKGQLVRQFLIESFIATSMAMAIGFLILVVVLPYFNQLSGKSLEINNLLAPEILAALFGLTIVISFLAGGYPAFFMSAFRPIQALKNRVTSGGSKSIRSGLVVFQFVISVSLIIGTLVVGQQMTYIQNKDVGYEREQLIVVRDAYLLGNDVLGFKDELLGNPSIQNVTNSSFVPAGPTDNNMQMISHPQNTELKRRTNFYFIDENYISTMGMEIIAGKNFSTELGLKTNNVIINETAIKTFGLEGNPIGQELLRSTDLEGGREKLNIVGIVKDFHARSLHEPIEPLMMMSSSNEITGLIIKSKTSNITDLIADMKSKWESFESGETFDYAFLDELYNETYIKEWNMNSILKIFALLTIFVACLGLFGLVTFTAEQRFKEIGIRKVLGSSVPEIVGLLTKDFLKLVLISMVVAFPLGYYYMNKWLEEFAYRIEIRWWVYALAGCIAMFIAFLTISYKSIKAANANPIKSLQMG